MLFDDSYKTIQQSAEGIFRDRGSRFIGIAFPSTDEIAFKKHFNDLKKIHHKANHHCYALRLTPDRSIFKFSDDREPSGSAGRPILNTLLSFEVTDCAIVVVRYFGGTLLGVPGLIHAYKSAAEEALRNATIIQKEIKEHYEINFGFDKMNEVMHQLKTYDATIYANVYENACTVRFEISRSKADVLLKSINDNYLLKDVSIKSVQKP